MLTNEQRDLAERYVRSPGYRRLVARLRHRFHGVIDRDDVDGAVHAAVCAAACTHDPARREFHGSVSQFASYQIKSAIRSRFTRSPAGTVAAGTAEWVPDQAPTDTDAADTTAAAVVSAAALTEDESRCVRAVYLSGLTRAEAARKFGLTKWAVREAVRTGLAKLRQAFAESEGLT